MLLRINFSGETPIFQQIRNEIVMGVAQGKLLPGEKLPTIRALADELGVNMMTVNKAYQLLKQEGYIITDRRHGAEVCQMSAERPGIFPEEPRKALRLLISEASLKGASKEAFIHEVEQLFQELEGEIHDV